MRTASELRRPSISEVLPLPAVTKSPRLVFLGVTSGKGDLSGSLLIFGYERK